MGLTFTSAQTGKPIDMSQMDIIDRPPIEGMEMKPPQPRWEYRRISLDLKKIEVKERDYLNAEGDNGWELVQIIHEGFSGTNYYYFKRQKVEE